MNTGNLYLESNKISPNSIRRGETMKVECMFNIGYFSSGLLAPTRANGCLRMTENSAGKRGYPSNMERF